MKEKASDVIKGEDLDVIFGSSIPTKKSDTKQEAKTDDANPKGKKLILNLLKDKYNIEENDGVRFILSSIRDPGNLGTMIRTASAFGYDHLCLIGCADIYNPKTIRSSMGSLFRVKISVVAAMREFIDAA